MHFEACYYSGCGNTFVIIDNRKKTFPEERVEAICALYMKVDGLILVENSLVADFKMNFFNNDGSKASMCGNGIRCMMRFLKEKIGFVADECSIETVKRVHALRYENNEKISVDMGVPQELGWGIELEHEGTKWTFHHVDTGVPHLVTFVAALDTVDVLKVGAFFRYHEQFAPQGANVNFVDQKTQKIRTYERGVESETQACGTGATACAYVLHRLYGVQPPVQIGVKSGEVLEIDFRDAKTVMTGPAAWICDEKVPLEVLLGYVCT